MINSKLVDADRKASDLRAKYVSFAGEKEKELIQALENMKVKRQVYHGNVLVGNNSIKVLERHKDLTNVIKDNPSYPHFNEVFSIFNRAMELMMARKWLKVEEIDELELLCHKFGEIFPIYFSENSLGKIHV